MAWIELHDGVWEHHKTLKLRAALDITLVETVGHLLSLWHFTLRNSVDEGDLENWGEDGIEHAARWEGAAGKFIKALRGVGLLDGFKVHDWTDFTLHYHSYLQRQDRIKAQVRDRVREWRQRQNKISNATVTRCNAETIPTIPTNNNLHQTNSAFDAFWSAYPRKIGKQAALKAWKRVKPGLASVDKILKAVTAQKQSDQWTRDNGQFIPHPSTWLNQGRWDDELPKVQGPMVMPATPKCPLCKGRMIVSYESEAGGKVCGDCIDKEAKAEKNGLMPAKDHF